MRVRVATALIPALFLSLANTSFATNPPCVSPDKSFGAFLQQFRSNQNFRTTRIAFPLQVKSNMPGVEGNDKRLITRQKLGRDAWLQKAIVPPTSSQIETQVMLNAPLFRGFRYGVEVDIESAKVQISY